MEFLPSVSDLFYLPVPLHLFGCSNYSASCFVVGELVIKVVFLKISKGKRWSSNIGVFVCKPFVIKFWKNRAVKVELAFLHKERVAASVGVPHIRIVVKTSQGHSPILQPTGDFSLATSNARASIPLIDSVAKIVTYGHTPSCVLFFTPYLELTVIKRYVGNFDIARHPKCCWLLSGNVTSDVKPVVEVATIAYAKWVWNCEITTMVMASRPCLRRKERLSCCWSWSC
ncbi:hypothetical protein ACFX13_004675 [Malus domestica]